MCRNDELSSMMSWVGCLLKESELFILFAENSQTLLKIFVIPILLTFIYLVLTNSTQQPTQLIIAAHNCHIGFGWFGFIFLGKRLGVYVSVSPYNISDGPIAP